MRSKRLLLSFFLVLINAILGLITLFVPVWGSVFGKDFGLIQCSSCSKLQENWSWECFARESCFNHQDPYCNIYSKGYYASIIYMYIEIGFLITSMILLEKLFLILIWRDCGSVKVFYLTLVLNFSLQLIATISWFAESSGSESGYQISPQAGAQISIAACVWAFISNLAALLFVYEEDIDAGDDLARVSAKCCGINSKIWVIISLVLFLLSACLIISSLSTDDWVTGPSFKGGLIRCKNCSEISNFSWDCLAGTECTLNSYSNLCNTYENLSQAGRVYLVLSALSLFFIFMVIQAGLSNLTSRKYGLDLLNYSYIGMASVLQLASTISWATISGTKLQVQCNEGLCGDNGINLAVASNIFLFPACVIYAFAGSRAVRPILPTIEMQVLNGVKENGKCPQILTDDYLTSREENRPNTACNYEKNEITPILFTEGKLIIPPDEILNRPL